MYNKCVNRSTDSPIVNLQISARSGRVDAILAGRLVAAVVDVLNAPDRRPRSAVSVARETNAARQFDPSESSNR